MKLGYQLKIEQQQKLIMTPELRQAIQILQYNSHELEDYVKEQVVANPVLEQLIGEYGNSNNKSTINYDKDSSNQYENYVAFETTLQEHLLFQLQFVCESKEETQIGQYIIESLDKNGYMTLSVAEIAYAMNKDISLVREVLKKIQQFEPAGIAAVSLPDCLIRQLKSFDKLDRRTEEIISYHLEDIGANRLQYISKKMGINIKETQGIADLIKSLNPKPGSSFGLNKDTTYIRPDVLLIVDDMGEYQIEINKEAIPQLIVSSYYKELMNDDDSDEIVKMYLTEKVESAVRLIKSIEQRRQTILNITEAIVRHQKDYFQKGDKYLKPLTLKQVADELDIHESTVSRTVNGKYLQSPKGVYELKFFFSGGVSSHEGENISSNSIKEYLREIVDDEDEKSPYSDQKIVELLKEKGFAISRRTVAKYRDEMGIPSSSGRKRY